MRTRRGRREPARANPASIGLRGVGRRMGQCPAQGSIPMTTTKTFTVAPLPIATTAAQRPDHMVLPLAPTNRPSPDAPAEAGAPCTDHVRQVPSCPLMRTAPSLPAVAAERGISPSDAARLEHLAWPLLPLPGQGPHGRVPLHRGRLRPDRAACVPRLPLAHRTRSEDDRQEQLIPTRYRSRKRGNPGAENSAPMGTGGGSAARFELPPPAAPLRRTAHQDPAGT